MSLLANRYQVEKTLSEGGFGKTFLAKDLYLPGQPTCVVKQLRPQNSATYKLLDRFEQEAHILYSLGKKHDQIPELLAHFEEAGEFYLVQEFIQGQTLNTEIVEGNPWESDRVLQFLLDVLSVLSFVHAQGVIHRDIKPGNLIRRHVDGKIVLIDFGAVKEVRVRQDLEDNDKNTSITIQIGSRGYTPPEQ